MVNELFSSNAEFHRDLVRNIPGIRRSQNLFDDLTADPADWAVAVSPGWMLRMRRRCQGS